VSNVGKTDEDIIRSITGRVFKPKPRKRTQPNRCRDCGRVTRHVRCHACMGVTMCGPCGWAKK
jgi:hypothetical protein